MTASEYFLLDTGTTYFPSVSFHSKLISIFNEHFSGSSFIFFLLSLFSLGTSLVCFSANMVFSENNSPFDLCISVMGSK